MRDLAVSLGCTGAAPAHAPSSGTINGQAVTFGYDKAGNLLSRSGAQTASYVYDWQNHLVSATVSGQTTSFTYDGDGTLAQKTDANGTVDYVGDAYERNVTTGAETKRYALGGQLVASRDTSLHYVHGDSLQSTVSASGQVVEHTPYGQVRTGNPAALGTDRQFQGEQNQSGIGLYHIGARWYDPTLGLWSEPSATRLPYSTPSGPLAGRLK